jgi:hypothetical protein
VITPTEAVQELIDHIIGLGLPPIATSRLLQPLNATIGRLNDGDPNNDHNLATFAAQFNGALNWVHARGYITSQQKQELRTWAVALFAKLSTY